MLLSQSTTVIPRLSQRRDLVCVIKLLPALWSQVKLSWWDKRTDQWTGSPDRHSTGTLLPQYCPPLPDMQ